jgi:cob(I)alamin adenosyltransferase
MNIYTRTGDDGTTGLIGGQRVNKSDPRIDCYGTVDELNAAIGWAAICASGPASALVPLLAEVQNDLFVIAAHLATPDDSPHRATLPSLQDAIVSRLESEIDAAEATLPPLRHFILPGGTELSARLHLSRTICRRAERLLVALGLEQPADTIIVRYLNRLSDWLYVQARLANHVQGVEDVLWVKPT